MIARVFSKLAGTWKRQVEPCQPVGEVASSCLGDLLTVADAWQLQEGFHQPAWKRIAALIKERAPAEQEQVAAWHDASLQWLHRLKTEMGEGFRVGRARHFLLVSSKSDGPFRYYLGQCERALTHLRARLGEAAWRWKHGKHAVLMFEDEDAYYRYISYFYLEDGEYGTSSGVCLRGGYRHTALAPQRDALPTLVHELTHLCLTMQRLPKWLEEGLAMHLEGELTRHGALHTNKEAIFRQRAFWNRENIQRFWSGESFVVGEERELSYGLAENLVALLSRELPELGPFILAAHRNDAGQTAVRQHLDADLCDVAAAFLGEGDWQPRPAKSQES